MSQIPGIEEDAESREATTVPPEGFQLLGDETAGSCTDGVCALPDTGQPTAAVG